MTQLDEEQIFEGVSAEIRFDQPGPTFGDLFTMITGLAHPNFQPSGRHDFAEHNGLGFTQVDDYFGIPSDAEEGDDVVVWLYPMVDGEPVHHHPGPFDAVRLTYCVLRNSTTTVEQFTQSAGALAGYGSAIVPTVESLQTDITAITDHWLAEGVTPGSDEALELDY